MVVILEVDAIEGVAFHYVDNFTMLILVFLSNCDVNKCSTNVLTLRSICAYPLVVEVVVVVVVVAALFYIIINFESITFFVILYPRHQGVEYLVSGQWSALATTVEQ